MLMLLGALWAGPALAATPIEDFDVTLDGYYRLRMHHFSGLLDTEPLSGRYITHRLRITPGFSYQDRAKLFFTVDALNNVVWGDNESLASTSLFAGDPTVTDIDGQSAPDLRLSRVWTEFNLPVGVIRAGRQPSNWGMGLLANGGDGLDDQFGENKGGATYDRIIFATKPIAIGQTIAGKEPAEIPLFLAVGMDRLVEDPLLQYYGYQCDADDPEDDKPAGPCEPDEDHSWTTDRTTEARGSDWWVDNEDDVYEMVYALIYRGEDIKLGGRIADWTAGAYVVHRIQRETDSQVLIYDVYNRLHYRKVLVEFEGLLITGDTSGITLPGSINFEEGADPLAKQAFIPGAVVKVGWDTPTLSAIAEGGFASGDDNVADEKFTGRPLNPEYNVGLLLYEEVLARASATSWGTGAQGLWSRGGVYNSLFAFPNVSWRPLPWLELIGAYLVALPHKPDGAIIRTDEDSSSALIGQEVDAAVKVDIVSPHLEWTVEGGWVTVTDRIPTENLGLLPNGSAWTVQSRIAWLF